MSSLSAAASVSSMNEEGAAATSPDAKFHEQVKDMYRKHVEFKNVIVGNSYKIFGYNAEGNHEGFFARVAGKDTEGVEVDEYALLDEQGDVIESEEELPYKNFHKNKYDFYEPDVTDPVTGLSSPSDRKSLVAHLFPLKQEPSKLVKFDELAKDRLYTIKFQADGSGTYYTGQYKGKLIDEPDVAFFAPKSITLHTDDSRPELHDPEAHINESGFLARRTEAKFYDQTPHTTIVGKVFHGARLPPESPAFVTVAGFLGKFRRSRRRGRKSVNKRFRSRRSKRSRRH
jgi:hypothetical protein